MLIHSSHFSAKLAGIVEIAATAAGQYLSIITERDTICIPVTKLECLADPDAEFLGVDQNNRTVEVRRIF